MANEEFVAQLRNLKVPEGFKGCQSYVDFLIEHGSDAPTATPEEAWAKMNDLANRESAAVLDLIDALAQIQERLQTIAQVVNQHTEVIGRS